MQKIHGNHARLLVSMCSMCWSSMGNICDDVQGLCARRALKTVLLRARFTRFCFEVAS